MEHIRTWTNGEFRLDMWDTGRTINGKSQIHYALWDGTEGEIGKVILEGSDFGPSPLHAIDSDEAVAALLGFLSLDSGDTDSEYFNGYTPEQIAWRDRRAADLQYAAFDDFGDL